MLLLLGGGAALNMDSSTEREEEEADDEDVQEVNRSEASPHQENRSSWRKWRNNRSPLSMSARAPPHTPYHNKIQLEH